MPELELDYYFRDLDQETISARLVRWAKTYWFCFPCFLLPFTVSFLLVGGLRAKNILDSISAGLQFGGLGFACAVGLVLLWKLDEYIECSAPAHKRSAGSATIGEAPVQLEIALQPEAPAPVAQASESTAVAALAAVQAVPVAQTAAASEAEDRHKLEAVHILFGAMLWIVWMGSAVIMVLAQCEVDVGVQMFTQPF